MRLFEDQKNAIKEILQWVSDGGHGFSLNARAGSGKSTLLRYLRDELKERGIPLFTCTLTNKSAAILNTMDETLKACTIHSLLSIRPKKNYQTGKEEFVPDYGNQNKLPPTGSIIAVDEASMGSESLQEVMEKHSAEHGFRWIAIGDEFQLSPIGEGLSDLLYLEPSSTLTSIKRHDNRILDLSSHLADCVSGTSTFEGFEEFLSDEIVQLPSIEFHRVLRSDLRSEYSKTKPNLDAIKFVAWTNRRCLGVGRTLAEHLGRKGGIPRDGDLMISNGTYTDGSDSAVFLPNNTITKVFDIEPSTFRDLKVNLPGFEYSISSCDFRLFTPSDFSRANSYFSKVAAKCKKEQNWRPFFIAKNSIIDLRQPYISTVHCSQGSSFKSVFIDVPDIMRNRDSEEKLRLLYVAVSRASERVVLIK